MTVRESGKKTWLSKTLGAAGAALEPVPARLCSHLPANTTHGNALTQLAPNRQYPNSSGEEKREKREEEKRRRRGGEEDISAGRVLQQSSGPTVRPLQG